MKSRLPSIILLTIILCSFQIQSINAQNADAEVFIQLGHSDGINSIMISPDGRFALSGGKDNTIKLWEISTGREVLTLEGHSGWINSVAYSPDGRYVLSGSGDETMKLWKLSTGNELRSFTGHSRSVLSVAFSPDGRYVLSGSFDNNIKLWDMSTGSEVHTFEGHSGQVNSVTFSADGRYVLSGSADETMKLWDVSTGREVRSFSGHSGWILSVALSEDGKYALSGSRDKSMKLWDISTGGELRSFEGYLASVNSVAFSTDGQYALSGGFLSMKLWEVSSGRELQNFRGHSDQVNSVVFLPEGQYVLSGSGDETMKLWEVSTGNEVRTFTGRSRSVLSVAFSPDGRYMLSGKNVLSGSGRDGEEPGYEDRNLNLIEVASGREVSSLSGHSGFHSVSSVDFSPDGQYALSGSSDHSLKLWEVSTGREVRDFRGHSRPISSVAFSPDGHQVLSGSGVPLSGKGDKIMKLWDVSSGGKVHSFVGHTRDVNSVNFSFDGQYVLSGSSDNTMKLWEVSTGRELRTFSGHSSDVSSVVFSPNGRYALSGSRDRTVKLWEVSTGREVRTITGHLEWITSVDFSPDGQYVLSTSRDKTVKLWEISSGREVHSFDNHSGRVLTAVFSPDGQHVLSAGEDGTTRLWDIQSGIELVTMISTPEGEWVIITPEGYFDASENGAQFINVRIGNEVFSIDNFYDTYYRPDIVRAKLAGEDIAPLIDSDIRNVTQLPPSVRFTSPDAGHSTSSQTITISAEITDRGSGIGEIRLMHNGSNISGDLRAFRMVPGEGQTITREFDVPLLRGENRFRLTAFNDARTESNPAEIVVNYSGAERSSDLHILAIGIDEYQNSRYNLNYGRSDAEAFAQIFEENGLRIFNSVNVTRIYDGDATRANIQAAYEQIQQTARPEDTFMFFYAGHGVVNEPVNPSERPDFYMALHDVTQLYGQEELLKQRGISASELTEWVSDVQARRQMVVFDACQAGGAIDAFAFRGAAEERAIQQLARSAGVAVLASSESEQFATEFAQLGHGVFTYALLNGLQGGAILGGQGGSITVQNLISYINQNLPDLTQQHRGQTQYPVSFSRGQDFPLMVRE